MWFVWPIIITALFWRYYNNIFVSRETCFVHCIRVSGISSHLARTRIICISHWYSDWVSYEYVCVCGRPIVSDRTRVKLSSEIKASGYVVYTLEFTLMYRFTVTKLRVWLLDGVHIGFWILIFISTDERLLNEFGSSNDARGERENLFGYKKMKSSYTIA